VSRLVVGTRGSALALWQTHWVVGELRRMHPHLEMEVRAVGSPGDRLPHIPLTSIADTHLFTRDLDEALQMGKIDLAVHSLKDVPGDLPTNVMIGAIPTRADPRDALVSAAGRPPIAALSDLPHGARVGTDSTRRAAQLRHLRPDLRVTPVRGNVDTRLRKLDAGEHDALVLAAAGLRRLGLEGRISVTLSPELCLSAPGQGALAITTRGDDSRLPPLLAGLHDDAVAAAVGAERGLLRRLGGGCQAPIAALATLADDGVGLRLRGLVASLDGAILLRAEGHGSADAPEDLAEQVARQLLQQGAEALLSAARATTA